MGFNESPLKIPVRLHTYTRRRFSSVDSEPLIVPRRESKVHLILGPLRRSRRPYQRRAEFHMYKMGRLSSILSTSSSLSYKAAPVINREFFPGKLGILLSFEKIIKNSASIPHDSMGIFYFMRITGSCQPVTNLFSDSRS